MNTGHDAYEEKQIVNAIIGAMIGSLHIARDIVKAPKDSKEASEMLDKLFNHFSNFFPPKTKEFLDDIYFKRNNLFYQQNLYEEGITNPLITNLGVPYGSSKGASASMNTAVSSHGYNMLMVIDSELGKGLIDYDGSKSDLTPVTLKLICFHEILVHGGMHRTILDALGPEKLRTSSEQARKEVSASHEMLAAIIDKYLIDLIPRHIIEKEAEEIKPDVRRRLLNHDTAVRRNSMEEEAFLEHRYHELKPYLPQETKALAIEFAASYVKPVLPATPSYRD